MIDKCKRSILCAGIEIVLITLFIGCNKESPSRSAIVELGDNDSAALVVPKLIAGDRWEVRAVNTIDDQYERKRTLNRRYRYFHVVKEYGDTAFVACDEIDTIVNIYSVNSATVDSADTMVAQRTIDTIISPNSNVSMIYSDSQIVYVSLLNKLRPALLVHESSECRFGQKYSIYVDSVGLIYRYSSCLALYSTHCRKEYLQIFNFDTINGGLLGDSISLLFPY